MLWCAQAPDSPLQVGALCMFEAGPLTDDAGTLRLDDLRRHVESRLDRFPRLRQRLVPVPFAQGRPLWVDDPHFDVSHHLQAAALPRPGDDAQLRSFVSRLIEVPLDPSRPLWEIWFVEGVEGDRVAVVPKISHVMADGMAVLELALALLAPEPVDRPDEPVPWVADPAPSSSQVLVDGVVDRTHRQVRAVLGGAAALTRPRLLVDRLGGIARAGISAAGPAPDLPFTRPVGPHRDFAWVGLPMEDLIAVKRAHAVTLNDVGLAVVGGALRHYLARTAGAEIDLSAVRPRVLVPVSTHTTVAGQTENRFSIMVAELDLSTGDPIERLLAVHHEMARRKASTQQSNAQLLFGLGDIIPEPVLQALGPPLLRRQPAVNLAVTNLPGTRDAQYLLGSRMLELYPYVSVTGNIALIIGMLSYGDRLGVGITVDADVVPDADEIAHSIERASRELVDASRSRDRIAPDGRTQRATGVAPGEHAVGQ